MELKFPGWRLAASADFNNDGIRDLIWQNMQTGQVVIWYMGGTSGAQMQSWTFMSGPEPGWNVVAAADFNRDGVPDLVWQNTSSRQVVIWYMGAPSGSNMTSWTFVGPPEPGWSVEAAADFNRDGVADLVWQNDASRQVVFWYMGGAGGSQMQSWTYVGPGEPGWRVVGAADLNGDGVADVVWQNDASQTPVAWYMGGVNGSQMMSWAYLNSGVDVTGWRMIVPH